MLKNPNEVRDELRKRILEGYDPEYNHESAIDHFCDWMVLSEEEFEQIKRDARNKIVKQNS